MFEFCKFLNLPFFPFGSFSFIFPSFYFSFIFALFLLNSAIFHFTNRKYMNEQSLKETRY